MKKWKKWTLGILTLIVIIVVIVGIRWWSSLKILRGTEKLSGEPDTIPEVTSIEPPPLERYDNDWISWYGKDGNKQSNIQGISMDWSAGLPKKWEVNFLCQGNSSASWSAPVIQGNRLVVCGRDKENDLIFCLNPQNGNLIWYSSYPARAVTAHGTGPRATPYIDGDRVYTFGRSGDLVCWNLFDGKKIWHNNVNRDGGEEPTWGHSSSPLILGDLVMVQGGGTARIIAYEKSSGNLVWKSGEGVAGYAAIQPMDLNGLQVILGFHGKGLAALEAQNGFELWNVPWETPYDVNATTPLVLGDSVFITSGYGVGCGLLKINRTGAELLWQNESIASMHSDLYKIGGFLYGYSGQSFQNRGAFKCIELKKGEEKWSTNDMGWGTTLLLNNHLLCCDIKGNLFLLKPDSQKFLKITEFKKALGNIPGPVWTMPIVANGFLYLRFKQKLVCYNLMSS
jgi:outer membrane protein assembly factor BamB